MANAAIGALIMHVIVFWGGDIIRTIKSARKGKYNDPHHKHMVEHYKEAPWWWYTLILVISFVLGIIVVVSFAGLWLTLNMLMTLTDNPKHYYTSLEFHNCSLAWNHYCAICELLPVSTKHDIVEGRIANTIFQQSTILYARYGNGIATNNLSKMIAGLVLPGRPVGNMYFAAWSHNVILCAVNLSNDLKLGEYREPYYHPV